MMSSVKKMRTVLAVTAASQHFLNSILQVYDSDSDSDSDSEFVKELLNIEKNVKIRGKRKANRIEGFVQYTIPRLSAKQFKEHFRMKPTVFDKLENKLGHLLQRQALIGRTTISVRKQLLATLWLLGTPDSYRSVGMKFDMAKSSLAHSVERVVNALNEIASDIILWPRNQSLLRTKTNFQKISTLPDVVGAIDGTFIEIPAPDVDAETYITRKCMYAVVLQGICDAELSFIDCFARYPGSVGDFRVFRNSYIWNAVHTKKDHFFPNREFIIGDKAYPLLEWCLPPYKDNGQLGRIQKRFNQSHSETRQVIERAFALLKGRFRRLKYLHMNRVNVIPKTILACCVLHNICLNKMDEEIDDDDEDIEYYILNGELLPHKENVHNNEIYAEDIEAINKRDHIAYLLSQ